MELLIKALCYTISPRLSVSNRHYLGEQRETWGSDATRTISTGKSTVSTAKDTGRSTSAGTNKGVPNATKSSPVAQYAPFDPVPRIKVVAQPGRNNPTRTNSVTNLNLYFIIPRVNFAH